MATMVHQPKTTGPGMTRENGLCDYAVERWLLEAFSRFHISFTFLVTRAMASSMIFIGYVVART